MWNKTIYDFGELTKGSKVHAEFVYNGDKKIKEIKASCGCTVVNYKEGDNIVRADYEVPGIASHLKKLSLKKQSISKNITVTFEDNSTQLLSITGFIVEK